MQATQIWQAALNMLSRYVPRPDFETWLKTSSIVDFEDGVVIVAMPNGFAVQWVESRHTGLVQRTLSDIVGYPVQVSFAVREGNGYFIPGVGGTKTNTATGQNGFAQGVVAATGTNGNGSFSQNAVLAPDPTMGSRGRFTPTRKRPEVQAAMPFYSTPGHPAGQQRPEDGNYSSSSGESELPMRENTNGESQPGSMAPPAQFSAQYSTQNSRELPSVSDQMGSDGLPVLNPKYLFDHFIVGSGNRMAHAASVAVADNPAHAYNPLFLYGGVGLGKTHLLHAIGHHAMAKYPGIRVLYVSSETFTNDLINAIREHTNEDFRNRYRTIDILMIDDIQFIAGKESTQEEFFHTFNALHGAGRQVILSSDRPPKAILTLSDRLRSRFEGGLIADVQPPDLETRIAILRTKGESAQIPVPSEVIDYVAHKIQSNIRELEGALNRIIAYALLNQKQLTTEVASLALNDLAANVRRRSITPTRVIETVASYYNMDMAELKAKTRSRDVVVPRQIAMYIIREETDASLSDIGAEFGNRDHTTVMHSCEKIERSKESDNQIRQALTAIRQMLYGELAI